MGQQRPTAHKTDHAADRNPHPKTYFEAFHIRFSTKSLITVAKPAARDEDIPLPIHCDDSTTLQQDHQLLVLLQH
jgi:hypothetical protein